MGFLFGIYRLEELETSSHARRAAARRKNLIDEATGSEDLQTDQIKLQRLNQEYKSFSKAAGLRQQHDRMETVGYHWKQEKAAEKTYREHQIALEKQEKFDKMVAEAKSAGYIPKNAAVQIPRREVDIQSLSFDNNHINEERQHNVTREMAEEWIKQSKVSITVWKGQYEKYYSQDGASYVNLQKNEIRTAFSKAEFDDETKGLLEVLEKYGY